MDYMTPVEAWIVVLASRGRPQMEVARRLVHMLLGVGMRTGHQPDLRDWSIRRAVEQSAEYGLIGLSKVQCLRCGIEAALVDWWQLGEMGIDMHRQCIVQAAREQSLPLYGYLLQCRPGTDTRQAAPPGGQRG